MSDNLFSQIVFALVAVGLPYFLGFTYLHSYYDVYGFRLSELGISQQEILVGAYFSIIPDLGEEFDLVYFVPLFSLMIFAVILALPLWTVASRGIGKIRYLVILVAIALLCLFCYSVASKKGRQMAISQMPDLDSVIIVPIDKTTKIPNVSAAENTQILSSSTDYLVYANSSEVFLLRRASKTATPYSVRLKKSEEFAIFSWNPWRKLE